MGIHRLVAVALVGSVAAPVCAQHPSEHWFSRCEGPIATCLAPQVSHRLDLALVNGGIAVLDRDETGSVCDEPIAALFEETMIAGSPSPFFAMETFAYASFELAPIPDDSSEILSRWEIAAQSHLPVITAERLRMQHEAPERSGQEVALACELQGPIDAADLLRRYDWSVTDDLDAVELTAVPKDALERLFYSRFTVTLDSTNWRPISIHFPARDSRIGETVALHPWVDEEMQNVQLVAFESEREQGLIRTADLSDDSPRLLRTKTVLELPPAPIPCEPKSVREPVEAPRPENGEPMTLRAIMQKFDENYANRTRTKLELYRWTYEDTFGYELHDLVSVFLEESECGWLETRPTPEEMQLDQRRSIYRIKQDLPFGVRWQLNLVEAFDPASLVTHGRERRTAAEPSPYAPPTPFSLLAYTPQVVLPVWADTATSLREKFVLTLAEHPDDSIVYVVGTRREQSECVISRIDIMFNSDSGVPKAVRTGDPFRTKVYQLRQIEIDGSRPPIVALRPAS